MTEKPSTTEVIGQRVELRRVGREFVGLCPFHGEKTPSFTVNEDKGVFYCHGCHEGGDVIRFVELIEQTDFKGALKILGIDGERRATPALTSSRKRAAEIAAAWVNEQRAKLHFMLAVAMEQRDLADEIGDFELAEVFDRELIVLHGFYDGLEQPKGAAEMLALRSAIEQITDGVGVAL